MFSSTLLVFRVPCALPGHDTPEISIFGMEGIPPEDLQRHRDGLPIQPYKRMKVSEGGLLPLLAAQKASVPEVSSTSTTDYSLFVAPAAVGMQPVVSPPMPSYPLSTGGASSLPSMTMAPAEVVIPSPLVSPIISSGASVPSSAPLVPVVSSSLRSFYDNIVVPPSIDPVTGNTLLGAIIIAPDLNISTVRLL